MTTNEIRGILANKNITSKNVTVEELFLLKDILSKNLRESSIYDGSARIDKVANLKFIKMSTNQWKARECISFNKDGFIGFAGWASSQNLQPILKSVLEWIEQIRIKK